MQRPRSITAFAIAALLIACAGSGCGRSGRATAGAAAKEAGAAAAHPPAHQKGLYEGDVDAKEDRAGQDADDVEVLGFGRAAAPADQRAVMMVVKRYYAAAAKQKGVRACALMYTPLAESVPEDYGRPPGPPALRGGTCGVVLSKLFAQRRAELRRIARDLRVTHVRTEGNSGLAVFDLGHGLVRHVAVHRERGVWKVDELTNASMP